MQPGSLVRTETNFDEVRRQWGFSYPKKGDILTVSLVTKHCNSDAARLGIVLLHFEELPGLIGISDKQIDGVANFVEILPPINLEEALKKESKLKLEII